MSTRTVLLNRMYINGEWVKAISGETFPVMNPANGRQIATVPNGGWEDAKLAVDAAHVAFKNGPAKQQKKEVIY